MADIEVVIKIPEELKNKIDHANDDNYNTIIRWFETTLYCAIKNGILLPEHHERLIEKINSKKTYKGRVSYSDMHDADIDKIHDIALDKAIEIIKNG